jgi:surfactin synthase thioesterase subunit
MTNGAAPAGSPVGEPRSPLAACDPAAWFPFGGPRDGARLRLFCFPHAGGGASLFRGWDTALPADVDLCAVQLPGREARWSELPYTSLSDLVEALGELLLARVEVPYAFFGHSLGGLVAFELARWLRDRAGLEPLVLFVSATRAPQAPRLVPPRHDAPERDFIAGLRTLRTVPEEILDHDELLRLVLPTLRADFRLYQTYRFRRGEPLRCPIAVFGGEGDHLVGYDALAGWRQHTVAGCTVRLFPGGHFFLRDGRDRVLEAIAGDLDARAAGERGGPARSGRPRG